MTAKVERLLAWLGLCLALGTYSSSLLGLLSEPFYAFGAVVLGVFFAGWNWYSCEYDTKPSGDPMATPEHRRSESERKWAKWLFRISITVFCAALVIDGLTFFTLVDIREPVLSDTERELIDDNITDSEPYVKGVAPNGFTTSSLFNDEHALQNLTVRKRPRIPWAEIETVELVVDEFQDVEPPGYLVRGPHEPTVRLPLIYLGTVDEGVLKSNGAKRIFPARLLRLLDPDNSVRHIENESPVSKQIRGLFGEQLYPFDPIALLDDDKPQRIILRANSTVSGIITYHFRIRFRYLWQLQTWESEQRTLQVEAPSFRQRQKLDSEDDNETNGDWSSEEAIRRKFGLDREWDDPPEKKPTGDSDTP